MNIRYPIYEGVYRILTLKSNEHEKDMLYYIPFCVVPDF